MPPSPRTVLRRPGRRCCLALAPTTCLVLLVFQPVVAELPQVRVNNIRRVFHNGEHNAFTDLVRFKNRFYLAFRSCPDGHSVHPTASVIVLSSDDAKTWRQVHRFRVARRDTRDPHFLVFRDRLFIFTGTWYSGETSIRSADLDLNKHLGYAAWSADGAKWHGPIMLEGTFGHYIWRASTFQDKAYLCGRRKIGFDVRPRGEGRMVESLMLESDDGLIWHKRAVFQEIEGDETAFRFEADGSVIGIGRRGNRKAQLLRSKPPYTKWQRTELDRYIGGPLLTRWGDRYVVGGRKRMNGRGSKTSMCWLRDGQLHEFAELPSGGDTSYPGFVELDPRRAIMSWYSSHERDARGKTITAIYMADLRITEKPPCTAGIQNVNGSPDGPCWRWPVVSQQQKLPSRSRCRHVASALTAVPAIRIRKTRCRRFARRSGWARR